MNSQTDDPTSVRHYGSGPSQFGLLQVPRGPEDPVETGRFPVLVVLHGGYWLAERGVDTAPTQRIVDACRGLPIATWNLEYRRLGETGCRWPDTLSDVGRGIDFLRTLATDHPLDLERVGVVGHSAGGQLALWSAGRSHIARDSELWVEDPLQPAGVVSLAGITDLERAFFGGLGDDSVTPRLMEGPPDEFPARYAAASPTRLLPACCPVILLHGTKDEAVALEQARLYTQAAETADSECELVVLDGADHDALLEPDQTEWKKTWEALVRVGGVPNA